MATDLFQDEVPVLEIKTHKISFGIGEPCEIHLLVNDSLFMVMLSPGTCSSDTVEDKYLKRLDAAEESEDYEDLHKILLELEEYVLKLCRPALRNLAPSKRCLGKTLNSYLAPGTIMLQIITINGRPQVRLGDVPPPPSIPGIDLETISQKNILIFRPSEITVLTNLCSTRVIKVLVNGQVYCCKLAQAYYPDLARELQVLQAILGERSSSSLRIPKLQGFVGSEGKQELIGFLMDYDETDQEIPSLGCIAGKIETIDSFRRMKWIMQIEKIVDSLHNMGIFWGDVKPDNVLVDSNDDIWLIDMGGSRTDGWVSEKLKDSIDGDLEGLLLLREYLKI